jgi:hypothetical protein
MFEEYLKAIGWLNQQARRVARWWSAGFDLLLTPTVWEPPATLLVMTPPEDKPWRLVSKIQWHAFFTHPFNVTGQSRDLVDTAFDSRWTFRRSSARRGDGARRPAASRRVAARAGTTLEQEAAAGTCLKRLKPLDLQSSRKRNRRWRSVERLMTVSPWDDRTSRPS